MYNCLKSLNIVMDFLPDIWIPAVNLKLQLREIKNGIPFKNNMSPVKNTYFWSLMSSLRIITTSPVICYVDWILPSGFPFKSRNFFAPDCMCNFYILDCHRTVYDLLTLKNPPEIFNWWISKFGIQKFSYSAPLICLFDNHCLFLETVFISTTALSVGL